MSKDTDADDLLGTPKKASAKKADAKPAAKKAAPAKKADAKPAAKKAPAKVEPKAKKAAPVKAKAERPAKEPITWADGERDKVRAKVTKIVTTAGKKGINSRDIATKIDIPTRKLRTLLYSMANAGEVKVKLEASRVLGMTVQPA